MKETKTIYTQEEAKNKSDYVAKDLLDAAQWITKSRFLRNRK